MAATTFESIENIETQMKSPETQFIIADRKDHRIIIIPCGSKAILSIITTLNFDPRNICETCQEIASIIAQNDKIESN